MFVQGTSRVAVTVDGTESEADLASLKKLDAVLVLLDIKDGVSRVHASR